MTAAIMVTTTACGKSEDDGAKASASTTAQADAGDTIDTGENESGGDTTIAGPRLGKNAKEVYLATSNKFK